MLDGLFPASELRERGIAATRQLAKRQITWQRSMQPPKFHKHIIAADSPTATEDAWKCVKSSL
jgi:tRNA dimethylallyltransferase